jgi:hypothetical protein
MAWKESKKSWLGLVGLSCGIALAGIGVVAWWFHQPTQALHEFPPLADSQLNNPAELIKLERIEALKTEIDRLNESRSDVMRRLVETESKLSVLLHQIADKDKVNQDRLAKMESEFKALRHQIADTVNQNLPLHEATKAPEPTPEEELEQAEAQLQAEVELFEGKMFAEATDPKWGSVAELKLKEAFQREGTTVIQLVQAECRTTLCRLKLSLAGSASREEGLSALNRFAPWEGEGFMRTYPEGSIVMYLAREGYSLPRLLSHGTLDGKNQ